MVWLRVVFVLSLFSTPGDVMAWKAVFLAFRVRETNRISVDSPHKWSLKGWRWWFLFGISLEKLYWIWIFGTIVVGTTYHVYDISWVWLVLGTSCIAYYLYISHLQQGPRGCNALAFIYVDMSMLCRIATIGREIFPCCMDCLNAFPLPHQTQFKISRSYNNGGD